MNSAGLKGLSQLSPKSCSNPAGENIVLEQDSFVFEPKVGVDDRKFSTSPRTNQQ
jgi:hypothetical protein